MSISNNKKSVERIEIYDVRLFGLLYSNYGTFSVMKKIACLYGCKKGTDQQTESTKLEFSV